MLILGIDKDIFTFQNDLGFVQKYEYKQIITYGVLDENEDLEVINKTGKSFEETVRGLQEEEINKFIILFVDIWGNYIRLEFKDFDIIYIGVDRIR